MADIPDPVAVANAQAQKLVESLCKVQWDVMQTQVQLKTKFDELWQKLMDVLALLGGGFKGLGSMILGELAAIAGSVASSLVAMVAAGISGAAAVVFQQIFKFLFMIFAAGPDAAFSLARLPLTKAREHTRREAVFLKDAESAIAICVKIIGKWTSGFDNTTYYRQMKDAMIPIQAAIDNLLKVMSSLDSKKFDESSYSSALSALDTAIQMTIPMSKTEEVTSLSARMNVKRQQIIDRKLATLKAERLQKLQVVDDRYRAEALPYNTDNQADIDAANEADLQRRRQANTQPGPHDRDIVSAITLGQPLQNRTTPPAPINAEIGFKSINLSPASGSTSIDATTNLEVNAVPRAGVDALNLVRQSATDVGNGYSRTDMMVRIQASWYKDKNLIDSEYDLKEQWARAEAEKDLYNNELGNVLTDIGNDVKNQFMADMKILGQQATLMSNSIKDAFMEYKLSQTYTQAAYWSLKRIKQMIELMLQLTRYGSFSTPAHGVVSAAEAVVEDAYTTFDVATKKFEKNLTDIPLTAPAETALDLSFGHTELVMAKAMLNAVITESLVKLINLDNVISVELDAFKQFQSDVAAIPDFDGNKSVWGIDPLEVLNTGKYMSLISKIAKFITTTSISILPSPDIKQANMRALNDLNGVISDMNTHNTLVMTTLNSWEPPHNGDTDELTRAIDSASNTIAILLLTLEFGEMLALLSKGIVCSSAYVDQNCKPYWDTWAAELDIKNQKGSFDDAVRSIKIKMQNRILGSSADSDCNSRTESRAYSGTKQQEAVLEAEQIQPDWISEKAILNINNGIPEHRGDGDPSLTDKLKRF